MTKAEWIRSLTDEEMAAEFAAASALAVECVVKNILGFDITGIIDTEEQRKIWLEGLREEVEED